LLIYHNLLLLFLFFILTCINFCNFFSTASSNFNFYFISTGKGEGAKISEGVAGFYVSDIKTD
jgi:hypothetical protein